MQLEIRERYKVKTWYYSFNHNNRRYRGWLNPVSVMNKREANAEVQRRFADVVQNGTEPATKRTERDFHTILDDYLDYLKEHRPKTYKSARSLIMISRRFFGKKPTKADVVEYQKRRRADGVTGASINRELSYCRAAVNRAIRQEMTKANPFDHFEKFRETARTRYLSRAEIKRLFDVLNSQSDHAEVLRDIVVIAIFSGMRRKEILNLHADEIDFDLNTITKTGDKTKNGEIKVVPMTVEIDEIVRRRLKVNSLGYVFENKKTGRAITDIKKSFKTALTNAKISDFKFHDLRHTFATYALLSSNNIRIVQDLLGHRSLKMTQRYTHVLMEQKSQVITAASKMIGDVICSQ